MPSAHWCIATWNNYPEDWYAQIKQAQITIGLDYARGQLEVGESGTPHVQFAMYFSNAKGKKQINAHFKNKIWMEYKTGKEEIDNMLTYVWSTPETNPKKTGTVVADSKFEIGHHKSRQTKGSKASYEETLALLKEGKFEDTPAEHQVKYFGNLLKLEAFYMDAKATPDCRGTWIYGPPGAGKSHLAREIAGEQAYFKSQNKWWDAYRGEAHVILDDFDQSGTCLGHYLKIWADKWEFTAEIKGGTIKPVYQSFIITSNYLPGELWTEPTLVAAITRRFRFITVASDHSFTTLPPGELPRPYACSNDPRRDDFYGKQPLNSMSAGMLL